MLLPASLAAWLLLAPATPPPASPSELLVERERVRSTVAAALEESQQPAPTGDEANERLVETVDRVARLGAPAVPFLVNELEQELHETFKFCTYALGRIPGPESAEALREAMRKADGQPGDFAVVRKALAGWALALQGDAACLALFDAGARSSAHVPIHQDTTVLEAAAVLTYPASLPELLAQLDRDAERVERRQSRLWTLRALRRLGDPAAAGRIALELKAPEVPIRSEAARTLGAIVAPASTAALVQALSDSDFVVRRNAAVALERHRAALELGPLVERLGVEDDDVTRAALYRLVAQGGADRLETLVRFAGRPHPVDRAGLVEAVATLGTPRAQALLRDALSDRDALVGIRAVEGLARLDSEPANDLLARAIAAESWPVAQAAVDALVAAGAGKAVPRILERLERELAAVKTNVAARPNAERLAEALVQLDHTAAAPGLRQAAAQQADTTLVASLESAAARLELLERNGKDVPRWIAALAAPEDAVRRLAYRRLGDIGGAEAAAALADAFDRAPESERAEALRALGRLDAPATAQVVERVLAAPEFDQVGDLPLRELAAWTARQVGGPRMVEALEASVKRRSGRDGRVVVYYGVLAGKRALPVLQAVRKPRLSYLKWSRGKEQESLDELAREIAAGHPLTAWDLPPERLFFR